MAVICFMLLMILVRVVIESHSVRLSAHKNLNGLLLRALFFVSLLDDHLNPLAFVPFSVVLEISGLACFGKVPFPREIEWNFKHLNPNFLELILEVFDHDSRRTCWDLLVKIKFALNHIFNKIHAFSMVCQLFVIYFLVCLSNSLEIFKSC